MPKREECPHEFNEYFIQMEQLRVLRDKLFHEAEDSKSPRERALLMTLEFVLHHTVDAYGPWLLEDVEAKLYPEKKREG
jgi:hypothetical protein